jgi:hypothetical protein
MEVMTWDAKHLPQNNPKQKKAETAEVQIGWPKEIFDMRIGSGACNTKAART